MTEADDCNCCAGHSAETPRDKANPPGLSTLAYRAGTYSTFKRTLLARLSSTEFPALAGLTTRHDDDWTIGLCDAFATLADVLTFYQERIVNEAFLRTAIERRSVVELARLVGYQPAPGVAAETSLAFTLDVPFTPAAPPPVPVTIPVGTRVQSVPGADELPQTFETTEAIVARAEWNALRVQSSVRELPHLGQQTLWLRGTSTLLQPGDAILLVGAARESDPGNETWDVRWLDRVEVDEARGLTKVQWTRGLGSFAPLVEPATEGVRIYAFRQRAALFGHNATDPNLINFSQIPAQRDALVDVDEGVLSWKNYEIDAERATIDLDAVYPKIVKGSWVALAGGRGGLLDVGYVELYRVTGVRQISRAAYGLSGKVTQLKLDTDENLTRFDLRSAWVVAQSEELELAERPLLDSVSGNRIALATVQPLLSPGQRLAIDGEVVRIAEIEHNEDRTTLRLEEPLRFAYGRLTMSINANVAKATHGETVGELAGSGDAALSNQRFRLRQSPLTYVAAANPQGRESTLEVRVNGLEWQEVPTLYAQPETARVYALRQDDEGNTAVQFGDGTEGARLPSGSDNVRMTYRKGLGLSGNVRAGALSTLVSRPLGIKGASNPVAASGGEDPESRDDARRNVPNTVLTLDRAVSVRDYEDFARAFAGVTKAMAVWIPAGRARGVHLTVAGGTETLRALGTALRAYGDALVPLTLQPFVPGTFHLAARIKTAPEYVADDVLAQVAAALLRDFGFDARSLGEPVTLDAVMASIHRVPGVVAVDVERLHRTGSPPGPKPEARLFPAVPAIQADGTVSAAELLTLDPEDLNLSRMP